MMFHSLLEKEWIMTFKTRFILAATLSCFFAASAAAQETKTPALPAVQALPAGEALPAVDALPAVKDAEQDGGDYARGEQIARELGYFDALKREPEKQGPAGGFTRFTLAHLLPNVYGRGGLSLRERELVIISIIIAQGNPQGLMWHFTEVTPRLGISERNLRELLYISCFYAGWPKCSYATSELGKVVMGPNKWPKELLMEQPKDETKATPKP
jgi:alkylhydroperoxidase/carboxymuconolactone decarboxylase family protein YurZ